MKRRTLLFTLTLLVIACSTGATSTAYPDSQLTGLLNSIQVRLFNDEFAAADSLTGELIGLRRDDPAGYLFKAVTLIMRMFDREEKYREEEFHSLLDSTIVKATAVRDTASDDARAWMCLWLGHAHAYRALCEARFGSMLSAITIGRRARDEYRWGLLYDSTVYDLYLGLGLFHYWKSSKAGLLRTVGLIRNDMDKGIAQLRLAADSSLVSRESARHALVWIRLDQKEYDSVIAICREALSRYPAGKAPLWALAQALFESRRYRDAAEVYEELRNRVAEVPGNYYNLIECDFARHRCYEKLKDFDRARQVARQARSYLDDVPRKTLRRQRTKIAFLRRAARI
ncbi:MAG: tetratricopeptide repeat protein [Candidatus Zixiibacteriota bacterium]